MNNEFKNIAHPNPGRKDLCEKYHSSHRFLKSEVFNGEWMNSSYERKTLRELIAENHNPEESELSRYIVGYIRYEKLRKLNCRQYFELYEKNVKTGKPFDDLVDELE